MEEQLLNFEEQTCDLVNEITDAIDFLSQLKKEDVTTYAAEKVEVQGCKLFEFLLQVKDCITVLETIENDLKQYAIDELYKYKNNVYEGSGFVCRMMESGISYDYKKDKDWVAVNELKKEIEDRLKKELPRKSTVTVKFERRKF